MLSSILKANKLKIYRWFNTRRGTLRIKSFFKYNFEYSEEEKIKLNEAFVRNNMIKIFSVEHIIQIAKEIKIDVLKVDNWFSKNKVIEFTKEKAISLKHLNSRNLPGLQNNQQVKLNNASNPTVQNLSTINDSPNNVIQNYSIIDNRPNLLLQNEPNVNVRPSGVSTSYTYLTNPAFASNADIYKYQHFLNPCNSGYQTLQWIPNVNNLVPQLIPHFSNQYLPTMPAQNAQQFSLNANTNQLRPNGMFTSPYTHQNQNIPSQNGQQFSLNFSTNQLRSNEMFTSPYIQQNQNIPGQSSQNEINRNSGHNISNVGNLNVPTTKFIADNE